MMAETEQTIDRVTVGPMEPRERQAVVALLARALRDNPGTVGVFGPDPEHRLRAARTVFAMVISSLAQPPLVARSGDRIVGAAAVSPPGMCFLRRSQARARRVRILGRDIYFEMPLVPWRQLVAMLQLGFPALGRMETAARHGASHDPEADHWHVELVGVEPSRQGEGIGGRLMDAVLRQTDASGELAYLETDTARNLEFYRRRGFEVIDQSEPLGVSTWYMARQPRQQEEGSFSASAASDALRPVKRPPRRT